MSRPKGSTLTPQHRQNISKAMRGKKFSTEHLLKWRLRNRDPELRAKRSELALLRWQNPEFRLKCKKSMQKTARTPERRVLMSQLASNRPPEVLEKMSNATLRRWSNLKQRQNMIEGMIRHWAIPKNRKKLKNKKVLEQTRNIISQNTKIQWQHPVKGPRIRKAIRRLWNSPTHLKKMWKAWSKRPNKAELKLQDILDEYFPNTWKYVGDGQLIIGGKCPDFADINGKKDLIELFGTYWHQPDEVVPRERHFRDYGYSCTIIWENELQDKEEVVRKIKTSRQKEKA